MDQVVNQQMTRSYLVLRIEIGGNDAELIAPNGDRYDVIVTLAGGLALVKVGDDALRARVENIMYAAESGKVTSDTIANDLRSALSLGES